MDERNGRPGRAYDENPENWKAWEPEATKITDEAVEAAARRLARELLEHEFEGDAESEWDRLAGITRAALEAALPHMSGVRVKPSTILSQIALWSDDEGLELSMGQGDDLVRRIMSAITSPAPEAAPPDRGKMVKPKPGAPSGGYGEADTAEELEVVAWGMPDKATKITDEAVEALLPCPFCRGPAVDGYHESFSTDSSFPFIGCERCGVEVGYSNSGWLDAEDRARAVSTWNTRALEAAEARLAEAVEVIDQLLDDMGEGGLSVCQAAKDQARTFLQSLGKEG